MSSIHPRSLARPLGEGCLAFLALVALYGATLQENYWGDGKFILLWVENGRWDHYHVAYLPLAQVFRGTVGRVLGWDTVETLANLSACAGAAAGAALFAAARVAEVRLLAAATATLLFALAPVTWFFSGCIEMHAVQMAASAAACLWAASASRTGAFGRNPVAVVAVLLGVAAGHLTGVVWAPAAILLLWKRARNASMARWVAATLLLLAFAGVFWLVDRAAGRGTHHLELGARSLLRAPSVALGLRELLRPAGVIYPLAGLAWLHAWRRGFLPAKDPGFQSTLLLLACAVPLAFLVDIPERGAYFVALLPVLCLWLALWFARLPRWKLAALGLLAVTVQGWLGWQGIRSWDRIEPQYAWIRALEAEAGPRTIVFTADARLVQPIQHHTPMIVFAALPALGLDVELAAVRERGVAIARDKRAQGYRIAVTAELVQSTAAGPRAFLAALGAELGELAPGADPNYFLVPAP